MTVASRSEGSDRRASTARTRGFDRWLSGSSVAVAATSIGRTSGAGDASMSHDWLVAAVSGEALAHRTGDVYYGAANGERLYREAREHLPEPRARETAETSGGRRSLRSAGSSRA